MLTTCGSVLARMPAEQKPRVSRSGERRLTSALGSPRAWTAHRRLSLARENTTQTTLGGVLSGK